MAAPGALQNITAYLNGTLNDFTTVIQDSSEYISETLGVPKPVVYSSLAALIALPLTMSRYGWSGRPQLSPWNSSLSGGTPAVTDEDFSYITSQDLEDPVHADGHHHHTALPDPDDDVLLIKNRGITYPAHFPAYAIGDGKLQVKDVIDRVGLMMDLSKRGTRRVKLLYKGRNLKDPEAPIREYGVKNKSELMAVLGEGVVGGSPLSDEEMVIVDEPPVETKSQRRRRNKKNREKLGDDTSASPRGSSSAFEPQSPPPPLAPDNPAMKKLDELEGEFEDKWRPLCDEFINSPPADAAKRVDEHRRISESVLQQILLKTDEVEADGIDEIRNRRKALVKHVQAVLKQLDAAKAG